MFVKEINIFKSSNIHMKLLHFIQASLIIYIIYIYACYCIAIIQDNFTKYTAYLPTIATNYFAAKTAKWWATNQNRNYCVWMLYQKHGHFRYLNWVLLQLFLFGFWNSTQGNNIFNCSTKLNWDNNALKLVVYLRMCLNLIKESP